ncbi:TolB-like 6-blade propeller-like [bacterium JGI 053]|nr:TolB-like 6-blade propeller-like [bacterium JGI 053]
MQPQHAPPPVRITSEILLADDQLGSPERMAVVGDYLVVLDAHTNPAVHVLRRADGIRVRAFGRNGSGPREFRGPRGIDPVAGDSSFWVFDEPLQRLVHVDLRRDTTAVGDRSVTLRSDQLPLAAVWAADGLILSAGLFAHGRLARFDQSGRMTGTVGRIPVDKGPPAVVQHAYTGTLVARPDHGRFALLTRNADRIELFESDGRPLRTVTGPAGFLPVYKAGSRAGYPVMDSGEDLRFGYVDASATGSALYGLYSGRRRGEIPGYAHYGTFVHEYDWEGRLRRVFKLDAYAIGIAVDPEGTTLYASRLYPTPAILRYRLPPGG